MTPGEEDFPHTPSPAFEKIVHGLHLDRRARQDRAVVHAHQAVARGKRVIIQAPTGIGKSFVALATAVDVGRPGAPGIVVAHNNTLGTQYLDDCRTAAGVAGFSYTRVVGRSNYFCADSPGARKAGVPGEDDILGAPPEVDPETGRKVFDNTDENTWWPGAERAAARWGAADAAPLTGLFESAEDRLERRTRKVVRRRIAWFDAQVGFDADPAVQFERDTAGLPVEFACPGNPACNGAASALDGCGCKAARERAYYVDVVISNFHVLTFAHKFDKARIIPLRQAPVVIIDEAHQLPDIVTEIYGTDLTEATGSRAFLDDYPDDKPKRPKNQPGLATATRLWLASALDATRWTGTSRYETTGTVHADLPDRRARLAWVAAWNRLSAEQQAALRAARQEDEGDDEAGDVLSLLRLWGWEANQQGSPWVAWAERSWERGRWCPDVTVYGNRIIYLRQVDAAAEHVPQMLPGAAVFLTGTVGNTLPARLGLPETPVESLGQEFDYGRVRGYRSQRDGAKSGGTPQGRARRDRARVRELAAVAGRHGGTLVLANKLGDVQEVAEQLRALLPDHEVFVPTEGGASAARLARVAYEQCRGTERPAVLLGVDSYVTGLDLKGELCTFVAWWTCVRPPNGVFDRALDHWFRRHGSYLDDQFRAKFAQGLGRLLRTPADWGEVMVCDSRVKRHLRGEALTRVDEHLKKIRWEDIPRHM